MYTRTRGCRLVILALVLTALCGTHADECVIDQDEEFNRTVCPQGWFETGSKNCLLFYNERLNQSAARAVCHKQDANLVRLYDDTMTREHHEYVLQRMNYTTEVWVALTYNSDSGNSTWPGETNQGTFFVGRRRSKAGHSCTTLVMTQGFLNAQLCDGVEYNYTCEIVKPAGGCPQGWHPLGDLKWCLYGDIKVASYTNASATCEAFNGTVITFKDYQKFMILNAFFRRVWLDASDEGNPSRFYWSNGALLGELVTEERHTHLVENCLSVDVNSYTRNDDYCSLEIPFACQKESEMGEGYPVMEINPRFITVEPDFFYGRLWKNVFFEGDDITVTCRALRLPNGTVGWTFKSSFSIGRKYIKFTRFNNMDNWVVNSVGTILLDDTCVNQTVSTFSTPALKNITFGFPSCYSKIQETYSMCPPGGEPLMFCDTTFEFNIIDRPLKGPEFRLEFSSRSHILVAGEWLVAHCQVYPVQSESQVWVIFQPNGTSRTLRHNVDQEITSQNTTQKHGKRFIQSSLKIAVNRSFDEGRVACFGYNIIFGRQKCLDGGDFCELSPPIHVEDAWPEGSPYKRVEILLKNFEHPATMMVGDILMATCEVYLSRGGSIVWAILTPNGTGPGPEHEVFVTDENDTETGDKRALESQLVMVVEKSLEGSRIACYGYNVSERGSLECLETDRFCAITHALHVGDKPASLLKYGIIGALGAVCIILFGVVICMLKCGTGTKPKGVRFRLTPSEEADPEPEPEPEPIDVFVEVDIQTSTSI